MPNSELTAMLPAKLEAKADHLAGNIQKAMGFPSALRQPNWRQATGNWQPKKPHSKQYIILRILRPATSKQHAPIIPMHRENEKPETPSLIVSNK
jgi:hypothetical protein